MKKIWLLTKIQLSTALDFNISFGENKKKAKKKGFVFYIGFIILGVILSSSSYTYSFMLGTNLKMIGMVELLPELMMAITCVVTLMTTIYKVKGTLFDFKDYDLVMSLPVRTSDVVASRLLLLYWINILFTLIIMIPAEIAYGILAKPTILYYIFSILTVFFIPLVPIIAATVIGTIITIVSVKFKHSNVINLIISLLFFITLMVVSLTTSDSATQIGEITSTLTKQVDNIYLFARMYREAVIDYNLVSIGLFIVISILAFTLFSNIVGLKFKEINTGIFAIHKKSNYKLGSLSQTSPFKALYRKELKRYFSSTIYVMNTGIGIVMMTIAAVAVLFVSKDQLAEFMNMPGMSGMMGAVMPIAVSFLVSMSYITACSISLEGKNLWILKASPIPTKTIFNSKIAVYLTIAIPAIIVDGILFGLGLQLSWKELIIQFTMPIAYSFFTAILGLIINLKLPNFNWTSEIVVVKQSLASLIAIFVGLFAAAVPMIIFMVFSIDTFLVNGVATIVVALIALLLYRYLNTKGAKIFSAL